MHLLSLWIRVSAWNILISIANKIVQATFNHLQGMQKLKPALFFLIIFCAVAFRTGGNDKIEWLKIDEATIKLKSNGKPVLIDLYTDWCYWCKVMDKKTYTNSKVIAYINEHFYSVKLNAETKESVTWKEKLYHYNSKYQINDFALFLSYGRASFPTTVIIPDDNSAPIPVAGFLEPKELEPILKYFGEGFYKKQNFNEYSANFKATW
jgi:thioredoxin-related protein